MISRNFQISLKKKTFIDFFRVKRESFEEKTDFTNFLDGFKENVSDFTNFLDSFEEKKFDFTIFFT